jgi:hypothetical protein
MKNSKIVPRTAKRPKRQTQPAEDTRTVKEILQQLVERLPPDCTWEDVLYKVYVCKKIAAGLHDARQGWWLAEEDVFSGLPTC